MCAENICLLLTTSPPVPTFKHLPVSVISGAKELFLKQFDVTRSFETGFVASAMTIGAALGTILAGPLQDSIGRKVVGSLACFVYTGAAVISATSNVRPLHVGELSVTAPICTTDSLRRMSPLQAYGVIVLGRIVTGVAIGLFSSTIFMCVRGAVLVLALCS